MNNKASYPAQAVYPQQTNAALYPPGMQASPQAPPYTDSPPSYSEIYQPRFIHPQAAQGQLHQMSSAYPQMYLPLQQSIAMGPMGHGIPMAYYPMGGLYPPGSTILVDGGYDSAARFGAGSGSTIPAPPPGQLPSAAQLAAMQGANVMMAQRKGGYFIGGSGGGGYTIW
ncbi:DAZ-associated protein 2 [Anguilla rostrata]|uniref:DAZ-associated protein 2 n=1 Tax=Anguilla anguilla TaxID=7936 RepID=A0A9D3M062_ANGAN|nr:DAZ-associated protein 2 [Anguilla anguilla]KAG5838188.1 hypothetical protein ANANG_G00221140 [Anguilla anguilla]